MTRVELIPDRLKMRVIVYRPEKPPHNDRFDPVSAKARLRVAREWGVDPDTFAGWCEEARIAGASKTFDIAPPPEASAASYIIRKPDEPREKGTVVECDTPSRFVKEHLPGVPVGTLAEWSGTSQLCCLDIDYHGITPPDREWLENIIRTRLAPKPLAWHFSKSGGLHLFYVATPTFDADELAACAALRYRSIEAAPALELKSVVFGPGGEKYHTAEFQDGGAGLIEWLGHAEYDEDARDQWLESEGMECGRRYRHEKCPIDPSPGAERDPVAVGEAGIYCFRCSGKGLSHGSRRPGWAPWAAVLGAPSAGELGGLIRNVVHWGHAKWVLTERYGLPFPLARLAYKAALKAYHDGKPSFALLPGVFNRNTEVLARVNNLWTNIEESHTFVKDVKDILMQMPATKVVIPGESEPKNDMAAVSVLMQPMNLADRGYQNISVVHGYKLASVFLGDILNQTTVAVPNPALKSLSTRALPRYVPKTKRMDSEEAWGILETILPRLDRVYIRGLIVAFGCAQETRSGLLPIIFASGPSSAGKTAMTQVACGIAGARVGAEATFDPEPAKFRAGVFGGGQEGPVVVFNELLKDATRGRHKLTVREALDFVLNMTPTSTSHKMYTGPVKMGRLPALVITDTACPGGLNEETQLARRIRHHYVSGRKDEWKKTISEAGVTDLHLIRTASDRAARACDAILSDVIDEFFSIPATWDEMADAIGIKTIEQSDDFEDPLPWMRELFRQTCLAPELNDRERRLYSVGYKKIERSAHGEDEDDLSIVYSMFSDGGANWHQARKLTEKDWAGILKVDDTVKIDIKGTSSAVYIRFRQGPIKSPTKVNQQIVDPKDWDRIL